MTFSGTSVIEWVVDCERDLAAAKEVRSATKITYLGFGPESEALAHGFEPLLFGLLWLVERSGIDDMTKVLVQTLREKVPVPLLESPAPSLQEFGLRRSEAFEVGHWDEANRGRIAEDSEAGPGATYYISTRTSAALTPSSNDAANSRVDGTWNLLME